MKHFKNWIAIAALVLLPFGSATAQDIKLLINDPDEPMAKKISFAKTAEFLDHQSRAWTETPTSWPAASSAAI